MSKMNKNGPMVTCPTCGTVAAIRTSRELSNTTREIYCQCQNIQCSHTWVAFLSAVRTIVKSGLENAIQRIPVSSRVRAPPADNFELF